MINRSESPALVEPAIRTEKLTKAFSPTTGVFELDLEVEAGQIFGFLGPNGSGKTTLIRLLLDYLRPDSGEAKIFGMDCRKAAGFIRPRLGYLPAEFRLYENETGHHLLKYLAGLRPEGALASAKALAERLSLRLDDKIAHFSKGMKQKFALIQALMHDPDLLLLDEPTDGFDPLIQQEFHQILREARSRGKTIFLSSHDLSEVEQLCDRVAIIRSGRLLAVEGIEALKEKKLKVLSFTLSEEREELFIPQATLRRREGKKFFFNYAGKPQELFEALKSLPIVEFSLEPARLEEIFLEYYH
ncbi:MAG TPA: hypothetical protein DD435_07955 [Cyanobacteria bacterium UBA8530]|nr:hypothetical protein [Cyanobacteria bacterium UBA8530]